jgi:cysteine desulfurase NifS
MKPVYLDYNATTPIDREVANAMMPFIQERFGNPSSSHVFGIPAREAVENAREQVAGLIGCNPDEIIFTSGGTESNNLAIKGAAFANRQNGDHIIASAVEHPAVTEVCKYLAGKGFRVTWLPVDEYGMADIAELMQAITPETILVTMMHANNEVGTIQPVEEIGEIVRKRNILFHSDAAQSLGKIKADVTTMGVDLLSVAGHKLYAPKGIGALYIRKGTAVEKIMHGADHEINMRAGTENVIHIVALGKACEIAQRDLNENSAVMKRMRELLHQGIVEFFPSVRLNGHPEKRLPNTLSLCFPGYEANTLLAELPELAASAGAACHASSVRISSVLKAMNVPEHFAMGTIRFSTGKFTTVGEIEKAISHLKTVLIK